MSAEIGGMQLCFLSRIFTRHKSTNPADYGTIFLRWDPNGKEYGPYTFTDLLVRGWSGSPALGRFDEESRWRDYSHFLDILDHLDASTEQIKNLSDNNVNLGSATLNFKGAVILLEKQKQKQEETEHARRALERVAKDQLPATPHIRKKMSSLSISYPDDITRAGAKELIARHQEEQALRKVVANLMSEGIQVPQCLIESRDMGCDLSLCEILEEFVDLIAQLRELGIVERPTMNESLQGLAKTTSAYLEAIDEAESAECDVEDKEIIVGSHHYRLVGVLPKKGIAAIKRSIVERHLAGEWSFDRDIVKLIEQHMPNVRLRGSD